MSSAEWNGFTLCLCPHGAQVSRLDERRKPGEPPGRPSVPCRTGGDRRPSSSRSRRSASGPSLRRSRTNSSGRGRGRGSDDSTGRFPAVCVLVGRHRFWRGTYGPVLRAPARFKPWPVLVPCR